MPAPGLALALVAGVAAVLVAAWVIRPIRDPLIGSDTASSVLYFERLLAGERLERFLGTTPKPALTLVDGVLWALGGWTAVAWFALGMYGVSVAAATAFAHRVAGVVAGGFVGTALVVSPGLLGDASLAYAVTWALLSLSLAGLSLLATPPRYLQAALWLALGGLARQEVLIVAGVAAVVVVGRAVLARAGRFERPAPGERRLVLGLLALPITAVHDALLTGDPLYTWRVPSIGAVGQATGGMEAAVRTIGQHSVGLGGIALLAALGLLVLVRRRAWVPALGLLSVIGGVSAVILVVGWRDLVVLERYGVPIELACIVAGGIGLAAVRVPGLAGGAPRAAWQLAVVAAVVAIVLTPRLGPLDEVTAGRIQRERQAGRDYAALLPVLRDAIESSPALRAPPADRDASSRGVAAPAVFVTPRLLSQAAVDLDLRLDRIARSNELPGAGAVAPETVVLHVAAIETVPGMEWTRIGGSSERGGQPVSRLGSVADRAWLIRFGAPSQGATRDVCDDTGRLPCP